MKNNPENKAPNIIPDLTLKQLYRICLPLALFIWLAAIAIWLQGGIDQTLLFVWDDFRQQESSLMNLISWFSRYGLAAFTLVILLSFVVSRFQKKVQIPIAILWLTICSFGISGIIGDILKEIIRRPRPAAVFLGQVTVWSDSLTSSIPSGHTTKAVAMILPFLFLVRDKSLFVKCIKILLVILASLMGSSRILLGTHFLSDVLAGTGTAFLGLPLSLSFGKMVLKNIPDEQLPKMSIVWSMLFVVLTAIFILL